MLVVMATIRAQPAHADTLNGVLAKLALASRREPGCAGYRIFRNTQQPHVFSTFEQWTNAAAERTHMASAHVAEAFAVAGPLLAAAPEVHQYVEI